MKADSIMFGAGPVGRPIYNLQKPQPQDQNAKQHQHEQSGISELFVKNSNGYGVKIRCSQRTVLFKTQVGLKTLAITDL